MAKSTFSFKTPDAVRRFNSNFVREINRIDDQILKKVSTITQVIYNTARARRPKISKTEQKAMGRDPKGYRVSDPNASFGVPVDTGDLQSSIKKEITRSFKKVIGRVYVNGPGNKYAAYIEYGTSKIQARPFMRQALSENKEWAQRELQKSIK
jgi:HK97 gp10 family phage protein